MRQFDVCRNPQPRTAEVAPFLVVLSSHLLKDVSVVVVAPHLRDRSRAIGELEVPLIVEGETLILSLTDLFSVESRDLRPPITSLAGEEDAIRRALERLFTGF